MIYCPTWGPLENEYGSQKDIGVVPGTLECMDSSLTEVTKKRCVCKVKYYQYLQEGRAISTLPVLHLPLYPQSWPTAGNILGA